MNAVNNVHVIGKRRRLVLLRIVFDSPESVSAVGRRRARRYGGRYELDAAGRAIALRITAKGYLEMLGEDTPRLFELGK